jgi:hypothetical protein
MAQCPTGRCLRQPPYASEVSSYATKIKRTPKIGSGDSPELIGCWNLLRQGYVGRARPRRVGRARLLALLRFQSAALRSCAKHSVAIRWSFNGVGSHGFTSRSCARHSEDQGTDLSSPGSRHGPGRSRATRGESAGSPIRRTFGQTRHSKHQPESIPRVERSELLPGVRALLLG